MGDVVGTVGGLVGGAFGGPAGAAAGKSIGGGLGNMFSGDSDRKRERKAVRATDRALSQTEGQAMDLLNPSGVSPELNQMTQTAIDRATNKAGAQLGVSQAQGGVTGGQAMAQQSRQAGDIQGDLQYQDALQRRGELLGSRKSQADLKTEKMRLIAR